MIEIAIALFSIFIYYNIRSKKVEETLNQPLMSAAKAALKKYYGYDTFRPMQDEIISRIFNKQDALVLMPTGGGKSVCFQIPAIVLDGTCIVVSPLISLMKDQVEGLKSIGIEAAFLNSSQTASEQREIEDNLFYGRLKLLYVSPEKVVSQGFLPMLKKIQISLFAIDEAHCISAWGHDFRPEYTQLKFIKAQFSDTPMIALTATADKLTRRDILNQLQLADPEVFVASFDRPNLSLNVRSGQKRIEQIVEFIKTKPNQAGIIYCMSRKGTEDLADKLQRHGFKAKYYHAQIPAAERAKVQEDFINDNIQIVCATVAFGMGIDKSNVRWVIHYNLPKNIEGYYQEIGRAGRDGTKADTILFYSMQDVMVMRDIMSQQENFNAVNHELQLSKMERMLQYADSLICRRKMLLNYFGENYEQNCGNCDVCKNPPQYFDGSVFAQKAFSAISRMNEQVGMGLLIDVLRGSQRQEIIGKGYDKIKTFGAGRDISFADWQFYLNQMVNQGLLEIAYDLKNVLKLTNLSQNVLYKGQTVQLIQASIQKIRKEEIKKEQAPKATRERLRDELFELLRELRRKLAQERGIPPYLVFSDASLEEMAAKKPITDEDMLNINGVGERKMVLFGSPFMEIVRDFVRNKTEEGANIQGVTYLKTFDLYQKGMSIDAMAAERGIAAITIYSHLAYLYEKGENIDLTKYISKAEIVRVLDVLQLMPEPYILKTIYEALSEEVEYPKIRLALAYFARHRKVEN